MICYHRRRSLYVALNGILVDKVGHGVYQQFLRGASSVTLSETTTQSNDQLLFCGPILSLSPISLVVSNNSCLPPPERPYQQQEARKQTKTTTLASYNVFDKYFHSHYTSWSIFKQLTIIARHTHSSSSGKAKYWLSTNSSCFTSSRITNIRIAQIISGKEVADEIRTKLREKVENLPFKPKLAIVQVGGREDSNVYIRMKIQFAESVGATAELVKLDRDITENELVLKIDQLNQDKSVNGIITQLPFDCSQKIDSDKIVNMIDAKKDVDGLNVYNAGKLSHGELNSSSFIPCTPNGCMELIRKSGVKVEGTRSVVIGRSKIVGSPMAQLLLWHNSTVTICHSRTKNIEEICRQADIVVAAVGRAQMVKKSWLKPGAVVIDCGINVIPDSSKKTGTRLVGDVDFEECKEVASAITPVPGGVGPMTVAMLISNTVEAASREAGKA